MDSPPSHIDGATVRAWVVADTGHPLGFVGNESKELAIVAIAIASFDVEPGQCYVFACDAQWRVIGDLLLNSIEEAKSEAERYYGIQCAKWRDVHPL